MGQVLWDDLVLAEFSLSVKSGKGSEHVNIDLARLCQQGRRLVPHFELETHGDAHFVGVDQRTHSIHVVRREADAYQLVYDSKVLTAAARR